MTSGLAWSLLGFGLYMLALYRAQFWVLDAEYAFLRRYRAKRGLAFEFEPEELYRRYRGRDILRLRDRPGRAWELMRLETKRVDDPELEHLRRRWRRRRNLSLLGAFAGLAVPIAFSQFGQW